MEHEKRGKMEERTDGRKESAMEEGIDGRYSGPVTAEALGPPQDQ